MEEEGIEINIVVEQQECFDDYDCYVRREYLYVNGDRVDTDGDHLKAVLRHLGYLVNVEYY